MILSSSADASGKNVAAFLSSDLPRYREAHRYFLKTMYSLGYSASDITTYTSTPDNSSWVASARRIVSSKPDVVVAYGAAAVATMLQEGDDTKLVASDAILPDGPQPSNLCGISARVPMITLIRALQGMIKLQKVAVILNSREPGSLRQYYDLCKSAKQLGILMVEINAINQASLEAATTEAINSNSDAIILTESTIVSRQLEKIVRRAKMTGIPVASSMPDSAKMGALVSLEISPEEQGQSAAYAVIRLLDGVRPDTLGIKTPRKVDLVINLKVAKDLDITVPMHSLAMATRLIK